MIWHKEHNNYQKGLGIRLVKVRGVDKGSWQGIVGFLTERLDGMKCFFLRNSQKVKKYGLKILK